MPSFNNQISPNATASDEQFKGLAENIEKVRRLLVLSTAVKSESLDERSWENTFIHNEEVMKAFPAVSFRFEGKNGKCYEAFYLDINWYDGFSYCDNWKTFNLFEADLNSSLDDEEPILQTKSFERFQNFVNGLK